MNKILAALVSALLFWSGPIMAANWEHLGERRVNYRVESDTIQVGRDDGRFSAIKLSVTGADVRFLDLKVRFGNGDVVDVPVRNVIPAGGETRVIDLPGTRRVIREVEFRYKTRSGSGKRASVHLWGRH